MRGGLRAFLDLCVVPEVPVRPLTRLLIVMIAETSLYVARAEDRTAARAALDRLLDGLETNN